MHHRSHTERVTNFDRSLIKSNVTDYMIRKKRQFEYFAPKITQNDPKVHDNADELAYKVSDQLFQDRRVNSKVAKTMGRRFKENFNIGKDHNIKNMYMQPCPWEPSGWRYPFLHNKNPPSTADHMTKRKKKYKDIANEKFTENYFRTAYSKQYREQCGFPNKAKKLKLNNSGITDTDRLNVYWVQRGVPENSNLISTCYPPIHMSPSGSNTQYRKLKRYSPIFANEKNTPASDYSSIREKNNKTVVNVSGSDFVKIKLK